MSNLKLQDHLTRPVPVARLIATGVGNGLINGLANQTPVSPIKHESLQSVLPMLVAALLLTRIRWRSVRVGVGA
jgi:hypothetical protein